eukprot:jgi/Bigna1/68088/fgenesh1_pg.5_\
MREVEREKKRRGANFTGDTILPDPGFVVSTHLAPSGTPVWINLCGAKGVPLGLASLDQLEDLADEEELSPETLGGKFPLTASEPRDYIHKGSQKRGKVVDVLFNRIKRFIAGIGIAIVSVQNRMELSQEFAIHESKRYMGDRMLYDVSSEALRTTAAPGRKTQQQQQQQQQRQQKHGVKGGSSSSSKQLAQQAQEGNRGKIEDQDKRNQQQRSYHPPPAAAIPPPQMEKEEGKNEEVVDEDALRFAELQRLKKAMDEVQKARSALGIEPDGSSKEAQALLKAATAQQFIDYYKKMPDESAFQPGFLSPPLPLHSTGETMDGGSGGGGDKEVVERPMEEDGEDRGQPKEPRPLSLTAAQSRDALIASGEDESLIRLFHTLQVRSSELSLILLLRPPKQRQPKIEPLEPEDIMRLHQSGLMKPSKAKMAATGARRQAEDAPNGDERPRTSSIRIVGFPRDNGWWQEHVDDLEEFFKPYGRATRYDDGYGGGGGREVDTIAVDLSLKWPMTRMDVEIMINSLQSQLFLDTLELDAMSLDSPAYNREKALSQHEEDEHISRVEEIEERKQELKALTTRMRSMEIEEKKAAKSRDYATAQHIKTKLRNTAADALQIERRKLSRDIEHINRVLANLEAREDPSLTPRISYLSAKLDRRRARLSRLANITIMHRDLTAPSSVANDQHLTPLPPFQPSPPPPPVAAPAEGSSCGDGGIIRGGEEGHRAVATAATSNLASSPPPPVRAAEEEEAAAAAASSSFLSPPPPSVIGCDFGQGEEERGGGLGSPSPPCRSPSLLGGAAAGGGGTLRKIESFRKLALGTQMMRRHEFGRAVKLLGESLALNPSQDGHCRRARANLYAQNFNEAEADATNALDFNPEWAEPLVVRACAKMARAKQALLSAAQDLRRAVPLAQEARRSQEAAKLRDICVQMIDAMLGVTGARDPVPEIPEYAPETELEAKWARDRDKLLAEGGDADDDQQDEEHALLPLSQRPQPASNLMRVQALPSREEWELFTQESGRAPSIDYEEDDKKSTAKSLVVPEIQHPEDEELVSQIRDRDPRWHLHAFAQRQLQKQEQAKSKKREKEGTLPQQPSNHPSCYDEQANEVDMQGTARHELERKEGDPAEDVHMIDDDGDSIDSN